MYNSYKYVSIIYCNRAENDMANYVKNADLLEEIIKYKETGIISEELAKMIMLIAENFSKRPSYIGYTWRDDMVSEAVLTCVKYIHNFKPEKSKNPFGYISMICQNAFWTYIKKQKTHSKIKDVCYNNKWKLDEDKNYSSGTINYENLK